MSRCPNCGQPLAGSPEFCSACGMRLTAPAGPVESSTHRVISMILLILIGVPAGLMGGCFVLVGSGAGPKEFANWAAPGIVGIAVACLLIWYVVWAYRKRR